MRTGLPGPTKASPALARNAGKQRGFLLIAAVVLIVAAALVLTVMVFLTTTGSISAARHVSSSQALFIAESGLEKGAREFSLNSAYAGETGTSFANGSFTITTSTTDFSGNTLPLGHIRLHSVGQTSGGAASRTLERIVGPENLLPLSANSNFNAPAGTCLPTDIPPCPTNWDLQATSGTFVPWDDTGGPETPDATRAAYANKTARGNSVATNAGNFAFSSPIIVTAPLTLQMNFDYKVTCYAGDNCNTAQEMELIFRLLDGVNTWSSTLFVTPVTAGWQAGTATIAITGSGTVSITQLEFEMTLKAGHRKEAWLDNLALTNNVGAPAIEAKDWREDYQ
jgi:hypothetical protein